jgi:ADP-ribose pyrophosphatase
MTDSNPKRDSLVKPWKELERHTITHSPYRKIDDVLYELPDGRRAIFSLNRVGRIAVVFALTERNEVILAKQFRPGPGRVLDELPGGRVEDHESFEVACARELEEETGYTSNEWTALGPITGDGYTLIERQAFVARNCRLTSQELKLDENEFIEVVLRPLPEFIEQVRRQELTDLATAWTALDRLGLVKP